MGDSKTRFCRLCLGRIWRDNVHDMYEATPSRWFTGNWMIYIILYICIVKYIYIYIHTYIWYYPCPHLHWLSWMGLYGSPTPKPSWLLGTPWEAYRSWQSICACESHSKEITLVPLKLRRWINLLETKITKDQKYELKRGADDNLKMVNRYVDASGYTRVSGTLVLGWWRTSKLCVCVCVTCICIKKCNY